VYINKSVCSGFGMFADAPDKIIKSRKFFVGKIAQVCFHVYLNQSLVVAFDCLPPLQKNNDD